MFFLIADENEFQSIRIFSRNKIEFLLIVLLSIFSETLCFPLRLPGVIVIARWNKCCTLTQVTGYYKQLSCSLVPYCFCFYFSIFSRFNFQDETPTTNFDTFPAAILTVFQVKPSLVLSEHKKILSWASLPAYELPKNLWNLGKRESFLLMNFATFDQSMCH